MAETGCSSPGSRRKISEVYAAPFRDEHTPIAQAVIGNDNNRHLGLVAVNGEAIPARAAFELWCNPAHASPLPPKPPA